MRDGISRATLWEYEIANIHGSKTALNGFGAEGWELVCFDDGLAYFKRPRLPEPGCLCLDRRVIVMDNYE